jgi:hypothetical protein
MSRACVRCLRLKWRRPTSFPSWATFGHPLSPARSIPRRKPLYLITSRPRPSFRQRPAKRAAIRKTGMPSTATTREGMSARRLLSPAFAPALSLTPPTLFPQVGESALKGIASVTVRSPAIRDVPTRRWVREYRRLFNSPLESCLGLTTQARREARPTRPSTGADCPARTDAGRSA